MAKTIKFNLILDEHPVRTIEGVREHFSIEDMLKYFDNGLLERWLQVRGYEKHFELVSNIKKDNNKEDIIIELIKIFDIEVEEKNIKKAIEILKYLDEEKELNAIYEKNAFKQKEVIDDYHTGYIKLIKRMEENRDNMSTLKATAIEMERKYKGLFELNNIELYFQLLTSAPKAIFAILTRQSFRKYWIGENANTKICSSITGELLSTDKVKEVLGDDLKIVKRDTQAMWDPIERKQVKVMVISINYGTFVKNAGEFSEKLSNTDVNGKLLIFNGLEYQCNSASAELLYMEV